MSWRPNIRYDHTALRKRPIAQIAIAAVQPRAFQASHPATAIIAYSAVQATGKTQFGGVQAGLFRAAYHSPGLNDEPEDAASATKTAKTVNDTKFRNFTTPNSLPSL